MRFFKNAGLEVARVGLQIAMDEFKGLILRRAVVWGVATLDEIGAKMKVVVGSKVRVRKYAHGCTGMHIE